ncbi:MAG: hypothetical protein PHD97_03130 [Bacteroidales bacterium]|nr:hypothetical protein [Bacteroidales bacterium]
MELESSNKNIIYLKWDNKEHLKAVSNLHVRLLPESILSKLGYLFLSRFYYTKLTKDNLIEVYLYKQNEEYVGFASCTNKPFTFMKEGMWKYFILIIALLCVAVMSKPSRLISFLKFLLKIKKNKLSKKLQDEYGDKMGEYLSCGVLEGFRKSIDPTENDTIPNVLTKHVMAHFKTNNKQKILGKILKSNVRSVRFFQKHSASIIPSDDPGEVTIIIEP